MRIRRKIKGTPRTTVTHLEQPPFRSSETKRKVRKVSHVGQGTLPPDPPRNDPRHQMKWVDAVKQTPLPIPGLLKQELKALELKPVDVLRSKPRIYIGREDWE